MILMIHRLFCCKISQWVIFWVWDPLVLVRARKSPSAGNPLSSIKGMILLLLNTCEQVDQIFCLHFLHRWLTWFNFVYPHLPDLQPKQNYSKLRLSSVTVKGPFNLFRPSSFASHFWVYLHHLSALNLEHGTKLPLVFWLHVLEYLIFYKYSCLFLWEKQCCLYPAFMLKWNSWEKLC